jgi:hypothetical protein
MTSAEERSAMPTSAVSNALDNQGRVDATVGIVNARKLARHRAVLVRA